MTISHRVMCSKNKIIKNICLSLVSWFKYLIIYIALESISYWRSFYHLIYCYYIILCGWILFYASVLELRFSVRDILPSYVDYPHYYVDYPHYACFLSCQNLYIHFGLLFLVWITLISITKIIDCIISLIKYSQWLHCI